MVYKPQFQTHHQSPPGQIHLNYPPGQHNYTYHKFLPGQITSQSQLLVITIPPVRKLNLFHPIPNPMMKPDSVSWSQGPNLLMKPIATS